MAELHTGFRCRLCGLKHDILPLSFSVKAPYAVATIPEHQRAQRVALTPDQCVIDGRQFFLRGRILIPLLDHVEPFIWGVWAEISPKAFLRTEELWRASAREQEQPFPGWLATELPIYGRTLHLALQVHTQPVGRRPHFVLQDAAHPLGREQQHGVPLARVEEIAASLLHARLVP